MPKCAICYKMLPTDLTTILTTEGDRNIYKCIFCVKGSKDVIIEGKMYNKEEQIREYERFLNELKEKPNIAEMILMGNK